MLVDAWIGQMDEHILYVFVLQTELASAESDQAFFVNEDGQGRNACDQDIDAQVPLVAVD